MPKCPKNRPKSCARDRHISALKTPLLVTIHTLYTIYLYIYYIYIYIIYIYIYNILCIVYIHIYIYIYIQGAHASPSTLALEGEVRVHTKECVHV